MGCPQAETYTVCIIYIKPLEMRAITVMLDERFDSVPVAHGDTNDYSLGRIGHHNVVVVGPARGDQGKVATAQFASTIRLTFPSLCAGMLVGIGGGMPHYPDDDVRLGDVVVGAPETGPAVVQYDLGKRTEAGFEVTRNLSQPPKLLRQVVNKVEEKYDYIRDGEDDILKAHIDRFAMYPRLKKEFMKPSAPDRLFQSSFVHEDGTDCANHDRQFEVLRHTRELDHIVVHCSTILSGDSVMKSSTDRDLLSAKHNNALCIEMEAAGLMDVFPCLVIRGICDYADSHKNSIWQNFAAATAAAYAREVLLNMSKQIVPELGATVGQANAMGSQDGLNNPLAGGSFSIGSLKNSGNVMYHNSAPMTNHFGTRATR